MKILSLAIVMTALTFAGCTKKETSTSTTETTTTTASTPAMEASPAASMSPAAGDTMTSPTASPAGH